MTRRRVTSRARRGARVLAGRRRPFPGRLGFSFTSLGLVSGLLADGTSAQRVSIIGDFAPCPDASAPDSLNTKSASYNGADPITWK